MVNAENQCACLSTEFAENYMEKLYYFCLKKTGSTIEAADLTQDIALNILVALNRGTIPTSFSAWVWQIARNRYSVWAEMKHRCNRSLTGSDISEYEIEDNRNDVLNEMIHSEQLSQLRQELAFIGRDYREILVAYYIENHSMRDVADRLSLSLETVKKRLQRARKILKEGMDMAREFGAKSYNPEDIIFAASGSQPSGLPWSAVGRKIPKNILLQASNNPSTPEELSMELGVALPYMEEEIELLHRATLLEQYGDKYITNFFVLDRTCQMDIYHALRQGSRERSHLIKAFIDDKLSEIRTMGIAGAHLDDDAIKWWMLPDIIDYCIQCTVEREDVYDPPVRANGETWGFVGYEIVEMPERTTMGHNGSGNEKNMFWAYKYGDYGLWDQCGEPYYESALFMGECIRDKRNISSFTNSERKLWENINGRYVHANDEGVIVPDILVMTEAQRKTIHQMLEEHKIYPLLLQSYREAYLKVEEIFKRYHHKVLHSHIGYYIRMEMYSMRMMAVHDLVDTGFLALPEDTGKSSLGMHLILK